jgi:hypothetical protein
MDIFWDKFVATPAKERGLEQYEASRNQRKKTAMAEVVKAAVSRQLPSFRLGQKQVYLYALPIQIPGQQGTRKTGQDSS